MYSLLNTCFQSIKNWSTCWDSCSFFSYKFCVLNYFALKEVASNTRNEESTTHYERLWGQHVSPLCLLSDTDPHSVYSWWMTRWKPLTVWTSPLAFAALLPLFSLADKTIVIFTPQLKADHCASTCYLCFHTLLLFWHEKKRKRISITT